MTQHSPPALDAIFVDGVNGVYMTLVEDLGVLGLPSGRVLAGDPFIELSAGEPGGALAASFPPGDYPVHVATVQRLDSSVSWVVAVRLVIGDEPVAAWELDEQRPGYGVAAGAGCFVDPAAVPVFRRLHQDGERSPIRRAFRTEPGSTLASISADSASGHSIALFATGLGDGYYPTWIGRSAAGEVVCFVTQFLDPQG